MIHAVIIYLCYIICIKFVYYRFDYGSMQLDVQIRPMFSHII